MSEHGIYFDRAAAWTSLGGHIRLGRHPTGWRANPSGGWDRKELVPFGQASAAYRAKYFRCAVCDGALLPVNIEYRFGCAGCGLLFGWSFGVLWGYPAGHERAMYLSGLQDV